jgi:hypothetical protein
MPSILSLDYARRLYALVAQDTSNYVNEIVGSGSYGNVVISARYCFKGMIRTGGLLVWATCSQPLAPFGEIRATVRLKKGWTRRQFDNAVHRVTDFVFNERSRYEACNVVERKATKFITDPAFIAAVEAEEKRLGKTSDYTLMTHDEATSWLKWLHDWAANHPE